MEIMYRLVNNIRKKTSISNNIKNSPQTIHTSNEIDGQEHIEIIPEISGTKLKEKSLFSERKLDDIPEDYSLLYKSQDNIIANSNMKENRFPSENPSLFKNKEPYNEEIVRENTNETSKPLENSTNQILQGKSKRNLENNYFGKNYIDLFNCKENIIALSIICGLTLVQKLAGIDELTSRLGKLLELLPLIAVFLNNSDILGESIQIFGKFLSVCQTFH